MTVAMMTTMPRPSALPTFSWPANTLPLRNDPIWIGVMATLPLVSASAVAKERDARRTTAAPSRGTGHQNRDSDQPPVLPPAGAGLGRLPPRRAQTAQRPGVITSTMRGTWEIQVDQGEPGERVQAEAVVVRVQADGLEPPTTSPLLPNVTMNRNANGTPPKLANTPDAVATTRRRHCSSCVHSVRDD